MKLKALSGIMLTLLFIGMLTFAFDIQSVKAEYGTIYIRADGSIDPPTAPIITFDSVTYMFAGDVSDSIVVERSNIIIDGNGYTLQGPGGYIGTGFELSSVNNVTIRNTKIKRFEYGVFAHSSSYNTFSGNDIELSFFGIYLLSSFSSNISENNIQKHHCGIVLESSSDISISGNNIKALQGIWLWSSSNSISENNFVIIEGYVGIEMHSSNNLVYHNNFVVEGGQACFVSSGSVNTWDDGYPSGGNYWSNYLGTDLSSGPYQNRTGSDGIGDIPCVINEYNQDDYPLMNPWTPTETSVEAKGKDIPVTIVSNTTLDHIVTTPGTLHFKSSGLTGETGYILVIFPMVNTTEIKVFIDGEKLIPPPFPLINSNGTHYFIYFEFTLSTHNIAIQFAPLEYTLAIDSSPTWVTFTVDGVSHTTPWSGIYSEGTSVGLVMPETHDGYVWSYWLEDGDPNRIKTVTMNTNITLTAVYAAKPVGGKAASINMPMSKPETPTLWIWLSAIPFQLVFIVVYVKKRKRT